LPALLTELVPGALTCAHCHTLVHAQQLENLAAEAKLLEAKANCCKHASNAQGPAIASRASKQADWIQDHAHALNLARQQLSLRKWRTSGARDCATRPVAILLAKGKGVLFAIFKLKFLFSLVSFIGIYWTLWGEVRIGFASRSWFTRWGISLT